MDLIRLINLNWQHFRLNLNWQHSRLNLNWKHSRLNPNWQHSCFDRNWVRTRLQNEDGSISVLVFGLFAVVLLSGVVLTDISAIIVAQRSLVQATESAAQSAAHALDLDTYYQGKHSALSFLASDASPVIPIDCTAANKRAIETLADIANTSASTPGEMGNSSQGFWQRSAFPTSSKKLLRPELSNIRISEFQCNGTEVLITASAKAWLPISLSLFSFESIELSASAGTTSVKKRILSLFGIL